MLATVPKSGFMFNLLQLTFSSPIVNLPWVCLFSLAKTSSFFTGSDCKTLMPNLTLPFVYSWPGCCWVSKCAYSTLIMFTHVNVGVIRKCGECLVQCLVHLLGVALEESSAACV
jgi:hypothetical protein